MVHNSKKLAKIVEELTMYFFGISATEISSKIEVNNGVGTVFFEANYNPIYKDKFEMVERLLSTPRNHAMEDEYWQLAGSGDPGETSQLLLIGFMTDNAEISLDGEKVKIKLTKKLK